MKQLTFAIFLLLVIGFTNGNKIPVDNFAVDETSFDSYKGSNNTEFNAEDGVRDSKVYFDDIFDDGYNPEIVLAKYLFNRVRRVISKIFHPNKTIRYQDNRFWNLTFLNKTNPDFNKSFSDGVLVHCAAFVNLERKIVSRESNDQYEPLPGQYRIEGWVFLFGEPERSMNVKLESVTSVTDSKHPDGVQMNILKEVAKDVPNFIPELEQTPRFGRFLSIQIEQLGGGNQMILRVATVLEKVSSFCHEIYPLPCPYVPIEGRPIESFYYLTIEKRVNEVAVLQVVESFDYLSQL